MISWQLVERRKLQEKFKALKRKQNQEMARTRYGIGFEMAKQKGKLKEAWDQKDKPKKKSLSETQKEAAGSGDSKALP